MTASVVAASATPVTWNGGGGPTTPAIPTGTTAGMLLLLPIAARTAGVDINNVSTYTRLSGDDEDSGSALMGEVWGKLAGGSESAPSVTSTIVDTQPTGAFLIAIKDWSGVIGDVFVSTPDVGTSSTVSAPNATALVNDTLVVRIYAQADDNTVVTPPAGHTQVFFQLSIQGSDMNMAAFVKDVAIASGVGAGSATCVFSGSDPSMGWTVLIPPATGGGSTDLAPADTTQGQTSDVPTLTQLHILVGVADTAQAQSADNVTLVQQHFLEVESTLQGQTSESPTLTQQHTLAIQDAVQGQDSETPTLNAGTTLVIADGVQGQLSDNLTLTQRHTLSVQDAVQEQIADRPVLHQVHHLSVQDSAQGQQADVVTLTAGDITTPLERTIIVTPESRTVYVEPENRTYEVEAEPRVIYAGV